ncbi:hypothetical protein F511_44301 [Dorcoceras hygrometricum]|uniref:Uncharacterized protein n=1 Tax=Dorcoceras hygrometricum TaxID=472368 RepID=A0A2Z7AF74_9LAMI|nr:hypothetical protein F511_44301 [Dorcoceras hygrometricum]
MKSQQWTIVIWTWARSGRSKSIVSLLNVDLRTLIITSKKTQFITLNLSSTCRRPSPLSSRRRRRRVRRRRRRVRRRRRLIRRKIVSGQFDEENPSVQISSRLLVQGGEGVSYPVMDRIGVIYRNLP